jgi:putative glutamine amidotransferase
VALSAPKPRIGITTYRQRGQTGVWDTEMAMIPAFYIEAITRAGGVAVLLPPQQLTATDAESVLSSLDGLMISGGRDVDASRYGQAPHQKSEEPDKLRDHLEDELINAAIKLQLPFLGICRGAQMLNVNRGGSLVQHLPDVIGDNRYQLGGGNFSFMDVKVQDGTKLVQLLGKEKVANAALYHHQAIDRVGEGLKVSAVSDDGVIEAIELENHPFGFAVQWHPEQTLEDLTLFEALIEAAQKYRSSK